MRKSIHPLGSVEMDVLNHVWELGEATVPQVHERIQADRKVAYTTIMTIMRNLANKGYLSFEKQGAGYLYRPAQSANVVREDLLTTLLTKAFGGSPAALVNTLVQSEALNEAQRQEIRNIIEDMED